jgi:hypothetical protein
MIKSFLVAAACALASADGTQQVGAYSVTFQGASGGFTYSKVGGTTDIKVEQSKVEEIMADGKKGKSLSVSGGSWGSITETVKDNVKTYSALYTSTKDGIFKLGALLTEETSETFDPVANKTVTVKKDTVKFSISIEGWKMTYSGNKVQYEIIIKEKGGAKAEKKEKKEGDKNEVFAFGAGALETPLTVTVDGKEEACTVVPGTSGSHSTLVFTFPGFENSLVYDPDVSVERSPASAVFLNVYVLAMTMGALLFV